MYTLKLKLAKAGIYTLLTSYKTVAQHIDIFSVLLNWFNYGSQSRNRCSQEYIFVCPFLASAVSGQRYIWRLSYTMEIPFHLPTRYGTELCVLAFYDTILTHKPWFARRRRKIDANSSDTEHVIRNFGFIFAGQLSLTTTSFVWGRCDTSFLKYFCVPINVCFRRCDCVAMAVWLCSCCVAVQQWLCDCVAVLLCS